jgi:hypothetical protein
MSAHSSRVQLFQARRGWLTKEGTFATLLAPALFFLPLRLSPLTADLCPVPLRRVCRSPIRSSCQNSCCPSCVARLDDRESVRESLRPFCRPPVLPSARFAQESGQRPERSCFGRAREDGGRPWASPPFPASGCADREPPALHRPPSTTSTCLALPPALCRPSIPTRVAKDAQSSASSPWQDPYPSSAA